VTVIDRTHLSILFNETINKTEGRIIVGEDTAMNSYNTAEAVVTDKTAVLELEAALPASVATSNMLLTVKGIKDLSGNAINATTGLVYPFMAPNDVTAPIALVSVTVDNKIEIVFGETIDEFIAADYTLVNAADTTLVIPSTFTYTPLTLKAVVLLNTLPTVTTNYILKLKDTILDQSVNQVKLVEKDYSVQIVIPVPVVTP
ncbi:MAG: hypothetical protein H7X94_06025, partial [Vallitaleaceae bacterium]|nr:hypothetical protein [Vallitaleaceae bacterium]